jgi:hypothetical protein
MMTLCRCGGIGQWEIDGTAERICGVCLATMVRLVWSIFETELRMERERRAKR